MLRKLRRHLINIPGWHTKRKIVVFDSDDWGSIGLPSAKVYQKLDDSGFIMENNPYLKYDSLASEDDLDALFNLLRSHKDMNGNHPVLTANTVVANPDFNKIRQSGFREYHYELFTDSLRRYPKHTGSFDLWKQGIAEGIFFPQFHAREHLNVAYWMQALRVNHPKIMLGFDNRFYILDHVTHPTIERSCTAAHYPRTFQELEEIKNSISDGLTIFEKIFGYTSGSFTGTGYIWHSDIEKMLAENGVKFLKGLFVQSEPVIGTERLRKKYHFTGQANRYGQIHLVRNAFFEPGLAKSREQVVADCIERIDTAFRSDKPALITTHRINFIGSIEEDFRKQNLEMLNQLLIELFKKHPEIEFMTSEQLGALIRN